MRQLLYFENVEIPANYTQGQAAAMILKHLKNDNTTAWPHSSGSAYQTVKLGQDVLTDGAPSVGKHGDWCTCCLLTKDEMKLHKTIKAEVGGSDDDDDDDT